MREQRSRYQARGALRPIILMVCFAAVVAPLGVLLEPVSPGPVAAQSDGDPEDTAPPTEISVAPTEAPPPPPTVVPPPPTEVPLPPTEIPPPPTDVPAVPTEAPLPPTEAPPPPTDVPLSDEVPVLPTDEPVETPYPIQAGWQDDPTMPWTLMFDRDPSTTWSGHIDSSGENIEVGFDLGSVQPIRDMEWLPTWPMQGLVEVQLSADGTGWYHLRSVDLGQQRADEWFTMPVGYFARYVRLIVHLPDGVTGQVGSLAEIRIWLDPAANGQSLAALRLVTPVPATDAPNPTTAVDPTSTPVYQQEDIASASETSSETTAAETALPTGTASPLPGGATGTVSGTGEDGLRCRTDPSLDAPIITVLLEGEKVSIRGEQQGDWLPVYCDGVEGYSSAAYVSVDEGAVDPTPVVPTTQTATEAPSEAASLSDISTEAATPVPTGTPENAAQSRIAAASTEQDACVPQTATFAPIADAMVYESSPTTSYGSGYELRARSGVGRQYESYLTFTVAGASGGVSDATLTLTSTSYTGSDTASAPEVRLVPGAWTESGITWNTKPSTAGILSAGGTAWGLGAPYSWDVTSAISGDGTVSFALIPNSPDTVNAHSREQSSGRPTLTVEFGCGGAGVTPVPETPTSTVAPTATATATPEVPPPTVAATATATLPPETPTPAGTSPPSATPTVEPTAPDPATPTVELETPTPATPTKEPATPAPATPTPTATASPTIEATAAVTPTQTCVPQTRAFLPTADALVYEANPTTTYGFGYELRARTGVGRQYESYLAFDVTGTSGGVSHAELTLTSTSYTGSDTASAPEVRMVTDAWTESGITWATKPAAGSLVAPGGTAWGIAAPYTWDVTAAVTGDGMVSFALIPNSPDAVTAHSREQGSGRPVLNVTFGCGSEETPPPETPMATATPSPTVTPPATPDGTATPATPTSTAAPSPTNVPATPIDATPSLTPTQVSCTPNTTSFVTTADAFVSETSPATNYGTGSELRSRLQTGRSTEAYLSFTVAGISDTVTSATLRLQSPGYSGAGTVSAPDVALVTGPWSETSITWTTRPATGETVARGGTSWDPDTDYTWDVTSAVTANGVVSLALVGNVSDQSTAHSREQSSAGTAGMPTLIVTTCDEAASPTALPGTTATPVASATPVPSGTPTPSIGGVTLVAVGDIACIPGKTPTSTSCQQQATSDTAAQAGPDAVMVLGDNQYECGSSDEFAGSYDPSWGQLKGVTYPVAGNHEYNWGDGVNPPCPNLPMPSGAEGYWNYFGDAATPLQPGCRSDCLGYYSFDIGAWHVVVLNSMFCGPLGSNQCWNGSAQETWLQMDLQGRSDQCVLAAWHHPLYSTGEKAPGMTEIWNTLYENGAEIVLTGHLHRYEQFGPQDAYGNASPYGMRQFVVGTGGKNLHDWSGRSAANLEVVNDTSFGVLRLNLTEDGYSWQFLSAAGDQFSTNGSDACHGAPGGVAATESSSEAVHAFAMVMALPGSGKRHSTRRRSGRQCGWSLNQIVTRHARQSSIRSRAWRAGRRHGGERGADGEPGTRRSPRVACIE